MLNVITQDADVTKLKGEAEIGLLSSKASFNIPIIKNKLALTVSERISNYSILNLLSPLTMASTGTQLLVYFGDTNANLFWKIADNNTVKVSYFGNSDGFEVYNSMYVMGSESKAWRKNSQKNGNVCWTIKPTNNIENNLFVYTDLYNFDYGDRTGPPSNPNQSYNYTYSSIGSNGLEDKVAVRISDSLNVSFGTALKMYNFMPFSHASSYYTDLNLNKLPIVSQMDGTAFVESVYSFTKQQTLTTGLRLNAIGNETKTYTFLEPRLGYHGVFSNDYSISASMGKMSQSIHCVGNSGLGFTNDMFFSSTYGLMPQTSWSYSLGAAKDFRWEKKMLSFKVDGWYRTFQNIVEFKDGYDMNIFLSVPMQNSVATYPKEVLTQGNGKAYGVDCSMDYSMRSFTFGANYTLMKAVQQFDDLNNGLPFAAPTDMRHNISLTSELKLSDEWSFCATWQFHTGRAITVPTAIFADPTELPNPYFLKAFPTQYMTVETERNNFITKDFHKLDISFAHKYKAFRKYKGLFSVGIYNVYNRANTFAYSIVPVPLSDGKYSIALKSMSLFPIMPSFNWLVKF